MSLTDKKFEEKEIHHLEGKFTSEKWKHLKSEFKKMKNREINSKEDLLYVIELYSEVYSKVEESTILKMVKVAGYSNKKKYIFDIIKYGIRVLGRAYLKRIKVYKYIYNSKYFSELPEQLQRIISTEVELNPKKKILKLKEYYKSWKYSKKMSKLTVQFENEEKTLVQLVKYLSENDRDKREAAWKAIYEKIFQEKESIDKFFNKMKKNRIKTAKTMKFKNYRDYIHKKKGRYDYTPEDCFKFHDAVEKVIIPYVRELNEEKRKKLNIDILRPWDEKVDSDSVDFKPYEKIDDLIDKMIKIFHLPDGPTF